MYMKILQKVHKLGSPEVPFGVQPVPGTVLPDVTSMESLLLYSLATSPRVVGPREAPLAPHCCCKGGVASVAQKSYTTDFSLPCLCLLLAHLSCLF